MPVSESTGDPPVEPFDLDQAWRLSPLVSIRPERFGAMLYHFGTRRLSFLKSLTMVAIVRALDTAPTARVACIEAGVTDGEMARYEQALASLAASQTILTEAA